MFLRVKGIDDPPRFHSSTPQIVGHAKTVVATVLGFFLLGGVTATPLLVTGTALNTVGGLW